MPTFKVVVQDKRKDGTYQVKIRVTHNRSVRRVSTNVFVESKDVTLGLKIKNYAIFYLVGKMDKLTHQTIYQN